MTKRIARISISVLLIFSLAAVMLLFTQCSKEEEAPAPAPEPTEEAEEQVTEEAPTVEAADYEDGIYFAQEDGFSEKTGWKYMVTLEVEDGEIVSAEWNGANVEGGLDKKTTDKMGMYNMVAFGGAQAEWYEQAEKAEQFLLENQDPAAITYSDDEGHTDDIAGVSIHVVEFFDLAEKALAQGPTGLGPYEDGRYFAQAMEFAGSGWKSTVDLTVVSGRIVAAYWDAVNEAGESKKVASEEGDYGMVAKGGAQAEWHVQAEEAEKFLLDNQDPAAITYDEEGYTDDLSGVSIHVNDFFELAEKALNDGPDGKAPYKDGKYHAEADAFSESSGWKTTVDIVVANGFIVAVNWNAVNEAGENKKEVDAAGEYGMVEHGGAQSDWTVQANLMEQRLLETQDPAAISVNEDGYPDAVSGVSIHVDDFVELAAEALAEAE
ncbi:MAG: hypothetical protein K9L75_00850 [Spirochaetia bacterium]|nr:hypothetical protein [Spirochaetia bacterium]